MHTKSVYEGYIYLVCCYTDCCLLLLPDKNMKELTKEELESMEKKAKCPILKCHIFRERNDVVILSEEIYERFQGKRVRITIEEVE